MDTNKSLSSVSKTMLAIQSEKAIHVPKVTLDSVLLRSVLKAFKDLGTNPEGKEENANYIVQNLCDEVLNQCPYIGIDEIPLAINAGVYGELGEYFGLNVVTFINFLKKYMESEKRKESVKALHKALEPVKPIPSHEEVQEGIKKTIAFAYNAYLEKGFYEDYGNFIYDKMDEMGLVHLDGSRKVEIYNQAQVNISIKKSPENAGNLQEFKEFTKVIDLISNPESAEGKNMIIREAKKLALFAVFSDIKSLDMDIVEYINQSTKF